MALTRIILCALNKKNLWNSVHYEQSYRRSFWPTLCRIFRKTIFRPLGGAAPQIFTRARELPSLTTAAFTGNMNPPYNFFQRVVKNWLKMQYRSLGVSPDETLGLDAALGWSVNASTTFGGPLALKFGRAKNVQKSMRFTTAFELSANISGTDKDNDKI